jgi:hypothetical protein
MRDIGLAYARFALDHPATFRVMFGPELAACADASAELQEASAASYAVLQSTARALSASDEEARAHAFAGWAMVHGAAVLYLDGALRGGLPPGPAARPAFEALLATVMRGGRPPRRRPEKKKAATSRPPPSRTSRNRA